jgi:hypothetical protein
VLLLASVTLSLVFLGPLWARLQQGAACLAVVAVAGGAVRIPVDSLAGGRGMRSTPSTLGQFEAGGMLWLRWNRLVGS